MIGLKVIAYERRIRKDQSIIENRIESRLR